MDLEMKYKVGDRVRIKSIDWYNENKNQLGRVNCGSKSYTTEMCFFCGKILTIQSIGLNFYLIEEDNLGYEFTDEMIEGLVEEETKSNIIEEAKTYWDSIKDAWICPQGYQFVDENGNVINATKIVLEKKGKAYNKGTKVRHKTKGMVETIVGVCKIKYMGAWVDGVIYEGNDTNTGEPITFVRVKEDFETNFEVC